MSLPRALINWFRDAGTLNEADTERDGFLSNAQEVHAVGTGIGLGFLAAASGELRYLGLLLPLVLYGRAGPKLLTPTLLRQILKERHYFVAGVVVGAVVGLGVRLALDLTVP